MITPEEILQDYDCSSDETWRRTVPKEQVIEAMEIYASLLNKELIQFRDATVGLYATDKPIGDLLEMFWQRSSDACPIECTGAEKQEAEFKEWVKSISFQIT